MALILGGLHADDPKIESSKQNAGRFGVSFGAKVPIQVVAFYVFI
jgi:hypothetical protein